MKDTQERRGSRFESRVVDAIKKLERIGFARDISQQNRVSDRNGHIRKLDISFVLCTYAIELLISIECKSRSKALTLDDVNQIKTFKRELPERNIYWLVVDGSAGENVLTALKSDGISYYQIEDLEATIENIIESFGNSGLPALRSQHGRLAMCRKYWSPRDELLRGAIHFLEYSLLSPFSELQNQLLENRGRRHPRISR